MLGRRPITHVSWSPADKADVLVAANASGTLWLIDSLAVLPQWGRASSTADAKQELNEGDASSRTFSPALTCVEESGSTSPLRGLALSADGKGLALVQNRFEVYMYSGSSPRSVLSTSKAEKFTPLAQAGLLWQPAGNNIFGWTDNRVSVYHVQKGLQVAQWQAAATINAADFSADGKLLAVGLKDGTVEVWQELTVGP